jgi:hypothetical protein
MTNETQEWLENELNAIQTADGKETELLAPKDAQGVSFLNPADFPDLDDADTGISLETKYYEFNQPNTVVRAVFNGIGKMNKRNTDGSMSELPAAYFQTKEGVYLNGGDNLVNQLTHVRAGTPIQITYLGKVKTNNGNNVNKFDIRVLNIRTGNPFNDPA